MKETLIRSLQMPEFTLLLLSKKASESMYRILQGNIGFLAFQRERGLTLMRKQFI